MSDSLKFINGSDRIVEQLRQSWDNRMDFPPTKIPERYARHQSSLLLEVSSNLSGIKFGVFVLISFDDGLHLNREKSGPSCRANDQFFVLIDNIEVMNDPQSSVQRVRSVMRLEAVR
jgi:hypothetical protein